MKVLSVVGARPQFIKAAAVSRANRGAFDEVMVHTGQHYDDNMSAVFFRELSIPTPAYNLGVSGGTHAQMTGRMLIALEQVMETETPDAVLLYGDTNSTLAAALAAVKLGVPIAHVEAGVRTGAKDNPEEINRFLTDRCSQLLLCATEGAKAHLEREGLGGHAHVTGNVMYDSFLYAAALPWENPVLRGLDGSDVAVPPAYYLLTCHRQENTQDDAPLTEIFLAMEALDAPTVYPVHPRNQQRAARLRDALGLRNLILTEPVGYTQSVKLTKGARRIVTDSGGLQCEAFYARVPCVTVLNFAPWPETLVGNRNQLAGAERGEIARKLASGQTVDPLYQPFGDGRAAERIVSLLTGEWER